MMTTADSAISNIEFVDSFTYNLMRIQEMIKEQS